MIHNLLHRVDVRDLIALSGIIAVAVGLWMVYVPAAFIVIGTLFIGVWVWTSPLSRRGEGE